MVAYSFRAEAAPTNQFSQPTCTFDVRSLPIMYINSQKSIWSAEIARSTTFLVAKDIWATAAHSIGYGKHKRIQIFIDGEIVDATLLYVDVMNDVALVTAPSGDLKPLALASKPLIKFEPAWTVGYPYYDPGYLHSYGGMLLNVDRRGFVKINALAIQGMSGGPAFRCSDGILEVMGINVEHRVIMLQEDIVIEDGKVWRIRTITNSGYSNVSPISNLIEHIYAGNKNYIIWAKEPLIIGDPMAPQIVD